jgi:hypothetical protein
MAVVAAGASIASTGFQAAGDYTKAAGASAADQYQADRLEVAARYGRLKAEQTGGQLTEQLNMTLSNIDAVRAAAHNDPTSPSGEAFRNYQETVGERQIGINVDNILAQSKQNEADAAYYRSASSAALLQGDFAVGADIFKGIAGALKA